MVVGVSNTVCKIVLVNVGWAGTVDPVAKASEKHSGGEMLFQGFQSNHLRHGYYNDSSQPEEIIIIYCSQARKFVVRFVAH